MRTTFKLLTTLIILEILSTQIGHQAFAQSSVAIGPKGGATFSNFQGDDAGDLTVRKGYAAGLFLNLSPVPVLSIQPELLFQQKGGVNESERLMVRQDFEINYLSVPLLFKLRLPLDNTFFPHLFIGPQFSYELKNDYAVKVLDTEVVRTEVDVREYDLGGVVGAGLDIQSKRLFFTTDVRYGLGALKVDENDDGFDLRNQDFTIMAGLGFRFGK